jgi:peptidyl-prolyl cis-trans isomerase D
MFDFVRNNTKIMMGLLFVLIIPSFVLFGLEGYTRFNERTAAVARVDGKDITQADWDAAHRRESDRLRATNPNIDPRALDSATARYATLERLVRDRVLAAAAAKGHVSVSDARLARTLAADPTIASLRRPDGTLDLDRYKSLVAAQGLTPAGFEEGVRADLTTQQLVRAVTGSTPLMPAVADVALSTFYERREIKFQRFFAADHAKGLNPTDADLQAYYDAHAADFRLPERANVEWVLLDLPAIERRISLNEADVRAYYDQNKDRFSTKEERRASHILIAADKSAGADKRTAAKARAQELLDQLRTNPNQFPELARKHSQDPASGVNGGDLDFFPRGAMVQPFEDAAFKLKPGELSDVVETDFGYHVIRLTSIKAPVVQPFESVRADLEKDLKRQQAQRRYAEYVDVLTNGVYEQADSLKPVADKLQLTIQTAEGVGREPRPGAQGPLAQARFVEALFSVDAVQNKRNTEAIEVGANQMAAGRIVKHEPARTRPLDEVRAQVRERVIAKQALDATRAKAQTQLSAWQADATKAAAAMGAPVVVARDAAQGLPADFITSVLSADLSQGAAWKVIDLGAQGSAVVQVIKKVDRPAPNAAQAAQDREQYTRWWSGAEGRAYVDSLKERMKAKVLVPKPPAADVLTALGQAAQR